MERETEELRLLREEIVMEVQQENRLLDSV